MAQGLGGLDDRPDKGREPETDQIEVVNAHLHSPPEHLGSSSGGTGSWLDSQDLERPVAKIWKRWGESNRSGRRRSSSPPTRSWRTRSAVAGCSWTRRKTPGSVHRRETMPATASTMITRSSANTSSNRPPSPSQARPARRSKGEFGRRGHVAGNGSSLRVLDPGQGHAALGPERDVRPVGAPGTARCGSARRRSPLRCPRWVSTSTETSTCGTGGRRTAPCDREGPRGFAGGGAAVPTDGIKAKLAAFRDAAVIAAGDETDRITADLRRDLLQPMCRAERPRPRPAGSRACHHCGTDDSQ